MAKARRAQDVYVLDTTAKLYGHSKVSEKKSITQIFWFEFRIIQ